MRTVSTEVHRKVAGVHVSAKGVPVLVMLILKIYQNVKLYMHGGTTMHKLTETSVKNVRALIAKYSKNAASAFFIRKA